MDRHQMPEPSPTPTPRDFSPRPLAVRDEAASRPPAHPFTTGDDRVPARESAADKAALDAKFDVLGSAGNDPKRAGRGPTQKSNVPAEATSRRIRMVRYVVGVLIAAVLAIAAASAATTWDSTTAAPGSLTTDDMSVTSGVVKEVTPGDCDDGTSGCAAAHTSVDWQNDLVPVAIPANIMADHTVTDGDNIRFAIADGSQDSAEFVDYQRHAPMTALLVIACVIVIVVAAWRGARALASITAALAVVWVYAVPALLNGAHPLQVALTASATIITVSVVGISGFSLRTGAALLGAFGSLGAMALAAYWAVRSARPVGSGADATTALAEGSGLHITVPGLVMCGLVIAGLGLLIEIATAQTNVVWSLRDSDPEVRGVRLLMAGMRAGRERITSTVSVLTLAYVGAALPALALVVLTDADPAVALTGHELGDLTVRALVATASLALAIPITTVTAALVAAASAARSERAGASGHAVAT